MHSEAKEKSISNYINSVWSLEFIVSQFDGDTTVLKDLASTIAFRYLDFPPVVLFHLDAPIKTPRGKSCAFIVTEGLLSGKPSSTLESHLQLLLVGSTKADAVSSNGEKEVIHIDCPSLQDIFGNDEFLSGEEQRIVSIIDKRWVSFSSCKTLVQITVKLKRRGKLTVGVGEMGGIMEAEKNIVTKLKGNDQEDKPLSQQQQYLQARSLDFASTLNLLKDNPKLSQENVSSTKVYYPTMEHAASINNTDASNPYERTAAKLEDKTPAYSTTDPKTKIQKSNNEISLVEKEKLKQLLRERYKVDRLRVQQQSQQ